MTFFYINIKRCNLCNCSIGGHLDRTDISLFHFSSLLNQLLSTHVNNLFWFYFDICHNMTVVFCEVHHCLGIYILSNVTFLCWWHLYVGDTPISMSLHLQCLWTLTHILIFHYESPMEKEVDFHTLKSGRVNLSNVTLLSFKFWLRKTASGFNGLHCALNVQ